MHIEKLMKKNKVHVWKLLLFWIWLGRWLSFGLSKSLWTNTSEEAWGPSVVTLGQVTFLQLITLIFKIIIHLHVHMYHQLKTSASYLFSLIFNSQLPFFFYMYTNYTIHGLFCILQYMFYHIHITVHIKVNQWLFVIHSSLVLFMKCCCVGQKKFLVMKMHQPTLQNLNFLHFWKCLSVVLLSLKWSKINSDVRMKVICFFSK